MASKCAHGGKPIGSSGRPSDISDRQLPLRCEAWLDETWERCASLNGGIFRACNHDLGSGDAGRPRLAEWPYSLGTCGTNSPMANDSGKEGRPSVVIFQKTKDDFEKNLDIRRRSVSSSNWWQGRE